jgi:hypothetical protein
MGNKTIGFTVAFLVIFCVSVFAEGGAEGGQDPIILYSAGSRNGIPCYWQNTARKNLSIPSGTAGVAADITVGTDGTVYIAGAYRDRNGNTIPCYWRNGVRKDLPIPGGAEDCVPSAIAVGADKTVHIVGTYEEYSIIAEHPDFHVYWQDGGGRISMRDLSLHPNNHRGAKVHAIAVGTDGTVYIAGSRYSGIGEAYNGIPCYWQNGVIKDLSSGTNGAAAAITVGADKTVYIAGYYYDADRNAIDCYWQNGVRQDLPMRNSDVYAIAVGADRTVYISAQVLIRDRARIIVYNRPWRGDNKIWTLGDGIAGGEEIYGQFIVVK